MPKLDFDLKNYFIIEEEEEGPKVIDFCIKEVFLRVKHKV